jgi:hypothetical protein
VMGQGTHLALGLAALAEAYVTVGATQRAADTAQEAIALLGYTPPEPGRDQALRRLSALADPGRAG